MELRFNVVVSLAFLLPLCSRRVFRLTAPFQGPPMTAMKEKLRLKTFHATMLVTRLEQWCVEAETAAQARALLAAGQGHRCHLGDCLHLEMESIDEA